jgi:hypothetical protein
MKMKNSLPSLFIFLAIIFCFSLNAQTKKELFLNTIKKIGKTENLKQVDSVYNNLKTQALEFGQDSLYLELTFQQIEKNGGLLLDTNAEILLENLLINQYYFLKKNPKLLLRCIHDLGRLYYL